MGHDRGTRHDDARSGPGWATKVDGRRPIRPGADCRRRAHEHHDQRTIRTRLCRDRTCIVTGPPSGIVAATGEAVFPDPVARRNRPREYDN